MTSSYREYSYIIIMACTLNIATAAGSLSISNTQTFNWNIAT